METLTSLVALIIVCAIIGTPTVVLGNYISKKIQERKTK